MFPIETTYQTGLTLYAVIHHPDGRVAKIGRASCRERV